MTHDDLIKELNRSWAFPAKMLAGDEGYHYDNGRLIIESDLYMSFKFMGDIQELPDDLTIKGTLDIIRTNIKTLPNNLIVDGILFLPPFVEWLPDSLEVGFYGSGNGKFDFVSSLRQTLSMSGGMQIRIVAGNRYNYSLIRNPTEEAKALHYALWEL